MRRRQDSTRDLRLSNPFHIDPPPTSVEIRGGTSRRSEFFQASDMLLRVLSDASFLSRPNAGSVDYGLSYLGLIEDDDLFNHPISCHSTRIPVECSFVVEAEYADLGAATRIATEERKFLANMSHPQPANPQTRCFATTRWLLASLPTPNRSGSPRPLTCACTETLSCPFIRGLHNVADFFTKLSLSPIIASWLP
jgi:hypothetical protein